MRRPSPTSALLALSLAVVLPALAACDTNDGRELDPPTAPPPVTTSPDAGTTVIDTLPTEAPATTDAGAVTTTVAASAFRLVAPWVDGAAIPPRHTCDEGDVQPALDWTGVPEGTVELAIVVTDDDADGFVHWIVSGIDPTFTGTLEGQLPPGAVESTNDFGAAAWNGPCPPAGAPHTYRFTLYALNQQLEPADDIPSSEAIALFEQVTLDEATVFGTYARG